MVTGSVPSGMWVPPDSRDIATGSLHVADENAHHPELSGIRGHSLECLAHDGVIRRPRVYLRCVPKRSPQHSQCRSVPQVGRRQLAMNRSRSTQGPPGWELWVLLSADRVPD